MSTALAVRDEAAIAVTTDQLDLIKRTVANGATADELKLYLFDCQRQGVHPLDKLVHFTKRSGKYTPITSIDFMRIRAADTGEYAGSDDATFGTDTLAGPPLNATVTVWRLVQSQRCSFTATARWSEYKPDQNDFMWKKMPHTMLAKCAEALALRKGFPRQLSGLYAKEEMDQSGEPQGYVVEAPPLPSKPVVAASVDGLPRDGASVGANRVVPSGGDSGRSPSDVKRELVEQLQAAGLPVQEGPDLGADLPPGARRIVRVGPGKASAAGEITFDNGESYLTWKKQVAALAEQMCQDGTPCLPEIKVSATGNKRIESLAGIPKNYDPYNEPHSEPLKDSDIPF